jgi:hypothetical protein
VKENADGLSLDESRSLATLMKRSHADASETLAANIDEVISNNRAKMKEILDLAKKGDLKPAHLLADEFCGELAFFGDPADLLPKMKRVRDQMIYNHQESIRQLTIALMDYSRLGTLLSIAEGKE